MKRSILLLFFVTLTGVIVWRYYQRSENPTLTGRAGDVSDRAGEATAAAKEAVAGKAADGKLTPENIKAELKATGRVVHSQARVVGERMDDSRIIAVIKGKYVMDNNLSVLAITVNCRDGSVKLTGSVTTEENIGRAVALALQTGGVQRVESLLVVKN
ncbi:MAG: BON domain-containing protein [Lacunisphaera sp.]|nr:BON domain-containing protein [Lacunisphaera sp.]